LVPLVTIFFDGLKPESLRHMPFLASLPYQGRMKTLLGYSVACHASMYTGVYPDRHQLWFIWQRAPQTSPHRWLKFFPFPVFLNHLPGKYFLTKTARLFYHPTALFGIPYIVHLPVKYWKMVDIAEKKFWTEPDYLDTAPSLFDHLRHANIPFEIVGMVREAISTADIIDRHQFRELKPWTYLFFGDVDGLSHHYTQESEQTISELKRFDRITERVISELRVKNRNLQILVFSDHGHITTTRKIDPYQHFKTQGDNLNRYLHIIDANYLRIWFQNPGEEKRATDILNRLEGGWVLSKEDMDKYHVRMPDHRYGDAVYYLDAPAVFQRPPGVGAVVFNPCMATFLTMREWMDLLLPPSRLMLLSTIRWSI
jgi:predicted AlkP superfamily pyrophosphatase or phosphodiesterase